ncbi:MAG: MBL fold metallo-hydrolase [bacterium]|nr:MAG: MBL fold metallo-hydrolase [bacterium]
MKLCVLGSGSGGNCTLVYTDSTALLVDAGFSGVEIEKRLSAIGFDPGRIKAVLLTHEHTDHLRGASVFSKKYRLPVYLTDGTYENANGALKKKHVMKPQKIRSEESFTLGDIKVEPFSIPHDAAEPVAFLFTHNERRALTLTDVGSVTVRVVEKLRRAHLAVLESNHDTELLKIGPYPLWLKQRVRGKLGHLSNDDCASLLKYGGGSSLANVIFAHISATNNNPDLVRISVQTIMDEGSIKYEIARQDRPGEIHEV